MLQNPIEEYRLWIEAQKFQSFFLLCTFQIVILVSIIAKLFVRQYLVEQTRHCLLCLTLRSSLLEFVACSFLLLPVSYLYVAADFEVGLWARWFLLAVSLYFLRVSKFWFGGFKSQIWELWFHPMLCSGCLKMQNLIRRDCLSKSLIQRRQWLLI